MYKELGMQKPTLEKFARGANYDSGDSYSMKYLEYFSSHVVVFGHNVEIVQAG